MDQPSKPQNFLQHKSAPIMFFMDLYSCQSVAEAKLASKAEYVLLALQGFAMPDHYNPAEFIADLISLDSSSADAEQSSRYGGQGTMASE
jgi:hypothetical protein